MVQAPSWTDRLPPQSVDAEEGLLGCILLDPGAIHQAVAINLRPEAFFIESHQEIYKAALAVHSSGQPVDLMSVVNWLHDHQRLEAIGGQSKLADLLDRTVTTVNADRYAALVTDKYYRRQIIQVGHEIAQLAHSEWLSQESLSEQIEQRLLGKKGVLQPLRSVRARSITRYEQLMQEVEEIELTIENPGLKAWEKQRIATKFGCSLKSLEDTWFRHLIHTGELKLESWADIKALANEFQKWLLHGLIPESGLILLHAAGGAGKTRLFYDWAYCVATGTAWSELFNVTKSQRKILLVQTDELPSEMFTALETRGLEDNHNIAFLRNWNIENVAGLNKMIEEFNPDLVLIDSLNSVSSHSIFSENDAEYARPVLGLRKLSEKHNISIFLIHHSNKAGDVRGSSAIKAACSVEMKLAYDPQHPQPDSCRRILTLGKTRSYRRPAEYVIEFDPETGRWNWIGEAGKEDVDIDLPIKERIVQYLSRCRNQRFEIEEIHHEVGGALDSVRRACCQLASDGLISRVKRGRRSIFFLIWEDDSNHRYDQQKNVIVVDRNDDRNGNAQSASASEVYDHAIVKNPIFEPAPGAENLRSHDRNDDREAHKVEPVSDTGYDQSYDQVTITPEKCDRKRDHEPENTQNSNTSLQSRDHDHECDRKCDREIFPSVNCQVGKVIDGERKRGWKGWIREIVDEQTVKVWWEGEFDLSRNGKPVKEKDGTNREKLTIESLENLCPFSGDTNKAPGVGKAYSSKHLPKKGDRVESCYGGVGEVTLVRSSNPRYEIAWDNGRTMGYTIKDLEDLDVRKVEVSHANG